MRFTLSDLAERVGGELHGDGGKEIFGLGDLRAAGRTQIAFVRDERFHESARISRAGALLVREPLDVEQPQIVVPCPDAAFARIAQLFHPLPRAVQHAIAETAVVSPSAALEQPVQIGPGAVLDAGCRVGAGTVIDANVVIESGVRIGRACVLGPNVTVRRGAELGDRVVLHSGAVIGSDGFGYAPSDDEWVRVPQLGRVVLGDDVEIGAGSTVDRATLGVTSIGRGTKIDNQVHIAHNCRVGEHTIIAGCSALSGSVEIGNHCIIAGHVVFDGHLTVPSGTRIGGASVVVRSIPEPGNYMGYPLQRFAEWGRAMVGMMRLPEILRRLRTLERRIEGGRSG